MTVIENIRISPAEFEALLNRPENANRWLELFQGVIHEVIMPKPLHGIISALIASFIQMYLNQNPIGRVMGDGVLFYLPNGDVFIPDAAYVSFARQPTIPERYDLAPDLAVEVLSPSNSSVEIEEKVASYLAAGSQMVWVVNPVKQTVNVWRPGEGRELRVEKLTLDDTLDGGAVLPGFSLPVRDIFPM